MPTRLKEGLQAKDICLSFGDSQVLKNVSIHLRPGTIHAISGENGAGKSSLAKVIAGLYHPQSGSIQLESANLELTSPREGLKHGIALIHQEPLPLTELTVAENIFCGNMPRKGLSIDQKRMQEEARSLLTRLGSNLDPQAKVDGLSIADQQMLELAAALAHDAKVWIFDETSAPLTPTESANLFRVMRELAEQGCAIAMVTHHMDEVFEVSDKITVLRDGLNAAHFETKKTTTQEVIRAMVGRDVQSHSNSTRVPQSEIALKLKNLSGNGFEDISFDVRRGEIFGLAGLVGAGRTEIVESIFGANPAKAGAIEFCGEVVKFDSPAQAIQKGIAFVPEDRRSTGLLINRSILENSSLPWLKERSKAGWINSGSAKSKASETLETLHIVMTSLSQTVGELSGGNQQKVVLSKWLQETPQMLILDEPTRGVDVGAKAEIHSILNSLADQGLPILVVSSDLPEILNLCDRIGVIRKGKLVGILDRQEATQEEILELASGGKE